MWTGLVDHTPIEGVRSTKSLKPRNWLGDLDSNQGFPSQSRKFYR